MTNAMRGYEKSAHLYDIFDTKENVGFFVHYGAQAVGLRGGGKLCLGML